MEVVIEPLCSVEWDDVDAAAGDVQGAWHSETGRAARNKWSANNRKSTTADALCITAAAPAARPFSWRDLGVNRHHVAKDTHVTEANLGMATLAGEIERIRAREILLGGPYPLALKPRDSLRIVLLVPYEHEYSLLCMGPLALYDAINRDVSVPAVAERAIIYACLRRQGNRLVLPDNDVYRTIESEAPVADADIVGVSITNAADLPSLFRLLDLAGIPRRSSERVLGRHPLVIAGNAGFANPEVMAEYIDVVVIGEGEIVLKNIIEIVRGTSRERVPRETLLFELAKVPGSYVPALYDCVLAPYGGVSSVRPGRKGVPAKVTAQYLGPDEFNRAHFVAPITDGRRAMMVPTLGCRWACHFCTLGVPPFRQAPLSLLLSYIDKLEALGVRQVVISSPTFTQYGKRYALLEHLKGYARRSDARVSTIIGSVRADELSARYLDAVGELGDFGHLFTELKLPNTRAVVAIAPEFASADLVRLYNKTLTPERVRKAIGLLRENDAIGTVMLYFIVGAPGETEDDRLAIADYAAAVFDELAKADATLIVKLQQFMPKPNTVSQRLAMADPALTEGRVARIRTKLRRLVGNERYERNFRVLWDESSRLLLESVCLRGDRRIGHVLERLHDAGVNLGRIDAETLAEALAAEGLSHERYLRQIPTDEVLPWDVINSVTPATEACLMSALSKRERQPCGDGGLTSTTAPWRDLTDQQAS